MRKDLAIRLFFVLSACGVFISRAWGQPHMESSLLKDLESANTIHARIASLNALSHYHYNNHRSEKAFTLISQMILEAEQSQDHELIKAAHFTNPVFRDEHPSSISAAEKKREYVQSALEYARRNNDLLLTSMAYQQLSGCYQITGNLRSAEYFADLASTNALSSGNDSAIILSYIRQGVVNQQSSKMLIALQKYSNALDLSVEKKLKGLESSVYHAMAQLYKELGKMGVSRELLFKSIAIHKRLKDPHGLMADYFVMAKMCDRIDSMCKMAYLENAHFLADSLNDTECRLEYEKLHFYSLYEQLTSGEMIRKLRADSMLLNYFVSLGPGYLEWTMGQVYLYGVNGGNPDSAVYYFSKAEDPLYQSLVMSRKKNFILELAMANSRKDIPEAIRNYKNLLNLHTQTSSWNEMAQAAHALVKLYEISGDYRMAFESNKLYDEYSMKYANQSRQNEVDVITLENSRKERIRQEEIALEARKREYNLQYLIIGLIIAGLFITMAMMGFYHVSRRAIQMVGFFSFLLFFEYVILLAKKWMTYITHGSPWLDFLLLITLAILMLPLHHWLEHRIVEYLTEKNLIKPHTSFTPILRRRKTKKIPPPRMVERVKN
jgi:hypothetical protein